MWRDVGRFLDPVSTRISPLQAEEISVGKRNCAANPGFLPARMGRTSTSSWANRAQFYASWPWDLFSPSYWSGPGDARV